MKKDKKSPPNVLLRAARLGHGWSQEELAEQLGTTAVTISRWENGVTFPTPYFRQRMTEIFGKTIPELDLLPVSNDSRIVSIANTRNPYFTGREHLLAQLHERLSTARAAALTQAQALYGLGGIGKTQTAAEYAFRYGDDYSNVFWIRAATRELLIADFVKLAQQLHLPEQDEQDQTRVVAAVKRWLSTHPDWLLILDNADDLPQAQAFLPNNHHGYVLFTTRAHAAGTIAASIEVEKLSLSEGSLLLLRLCKLLGRDAPLDSISKDVRIAAERIVKEMDGLPLALTQVGAYVEETSCGLTGFLALYATHRASLLARRSNLSLDYDETVSTTWSLSFQQIEQRSPAAADVLRLCAFLVPDAIPEELLIRGATELKPTTNAVIIDPFKLNETMEVLLKYSLVRRNGETRILNIHRLVQTVLKESMDGETQRTWAECTVRVVNAALPEDTSGSGLNHFHYLQYYLPHVQECATLIEQYHLQFPEAAQLLYRAGIFLYAHGFYAQSEALLLQALSIREQVLGSEHLATADILNFLAMLSRLKGDFDHAEAFHQRTFAIREKALGPQHPITAESLNNLGVLYRNQGFYEKAEPFLRRASHIYEHVLGSEHPSTLISFINLAKLYLEQGKYELSGQLLQQTLTTFERIKGPEDPLIALNLHLLAMLSWKQGNYEQAEASWKRAIAMLENTLGPEYPGIAESLNCLAELFFVQHRYIQAHALCERALVLSETALGFEHPETNIYRKHLAAIASKRAEEEKRMHDPPPSH